MATSQDATLRNLLASLQTQNINTVQVLEDITDELKRLHRSKLTVANAIKENCFFPSLAEVLETNFEEWQSRFPRWIWTLIDEAFSYGDDLNIFPVEKTRPLVSALRKYAMSGSWYCMDTLRLLAGYSAAQQILVEDDELFNMLKKELRQPFTLKFFSNLSGGSFAPAQKKILDDPEFVSYLLKRIENNDGDNDAWFVLDNLTTHPDAKTLLPKKQVINMASKSRYEWASDMCTLLCSDDDLNDLKVSSTWIEDRVELLNSLLLRGYAKLGSYHISLITVILPIANLSVADSYKDKLKQAVAPLLKVVLAENLPDTASVKNHLIRSRQESSRAVWNLAYLESNCTLIKEAGGIEKLKTEWERTEDPIIKKNIEGILHMCKPPVNTSLPEEVKVTSKHIMISYNWGNQPIVKKIAKSLKEHGYNVWLDLEQMKDSTLGAMALAIEHADLVLLCMSQKYKDSPNCRLEGEYCVNRNVPFLPLMMQSGYAPDGWLGIALGAKLWLDFSDELNWETKVAGLVKAIGDRGKSGAPTKPTATKVNPVEKWTSGDLLEWMKAENIEKHFETFEKHQIDGRALLELQAQNLKLVHFKEICKDMEIYEIGAILRLSAAIRRL